jgi:2-amino-4-hydroxy-6-hydroxymethyldihydropteridine diphosphokinase
MAPTLQPVAIALGSNLGDCKDTLAKALDALAHVEGVTVQCRSSWYRSAAVGPVQPDYLNGCALLQVSLAPEDLLDCLQETEQRFGRLRAERWGPRTLDLDLLFYAQLRLDTERLEVPHPRLRERAFVLQPLAEIAPNWVDPVSGRTVQELAALLGDGGDVKLLEESQRCCWAH